MARWLLQIEYGNQYRICPRDWREGRRFRAWELKQQGWTRRLIAAALGVTPGAVSQWMTRVRESGIDGLRRRIAPGRQPKLPAEQVAQLPGLLAQGAAAWGFLDEVWTTPRIAAVIEQGFWDALPSGAPQSAAAGDRLESPEADAAGDPTQRGRHRDLVPSAGQP